MSATISVSFFARKSRAKADGQTPVFMRVKLGGEHFDTTTKLFINVENWCGQTGKLKGSTENIKRTNANLEAFKVKMFDIQRALMISGKPLTITAFRNKWLGIESERPRMILEIFEQHNAQMKELINKEYSPLTYERYVTSKKHTLEFLKWKYHSTDIRIKDPI